MSTVEVPAFQPTGQLHPHPDGKRRWLLLYTCQAPGLANCLHLLSNEIAVDYYTVGALFEARDKVNSELDQYERVLISPGVENSVPLDLEGREGVWRLPNVHFGAYHPDICILAQEGPLSTGPLGKYHSGLAYAAFRCGLDVGQAVSVFRAETYAALGYLDRWSSDREHLLGGFKRVGFDIGPAFLSWCRRGPFMYATNRPKIECLHDLAKVVLARAGLPTTDSGLLPGDNMADGPVFPVYPEIAARLGVAGSYFFKVEDVCKVIDLEEFVASCFDIYRECGDIEPNWPHFRPVLDNAIAYLRSRQ